MKPKALICCLALTTLCVPQITNAQNSRYGSISTKVGTLGVGVEYIQPINKYLGGRVGANFLDWNHDLDESGVSYDADFELRSVSLMADYHPWADSFRITAGVLYNNNKIAVTAEPDSRNMYEINDINYPASAIDSITGEIDFNRMVPYLGIGWGVHPTSNHRWSLNVDLGVMYHGEPDPSLHVQCSHALPAIACNRLRADVAAEEKQLKDEISDYRWYPVLSVGMSYNF